MFYTVVVIVENFKEKYSLKHLFYISYNVFTSEIIKIIQNLHRMVFSTFTLFRWKVIL